MSRLARKQYGHRGLAGCVLTWRSRATRTRVSVYHGHQAEIDVEPDSPWVTLCEEHTGHVCSSTLKGALTLRDPREFCDECREEKGEPC